MSHTSIPPVSHPDPDRIERRAIQRDVIAAHRLAVARLVRETFPGRADLLPEGEAVGLFGVLIALHRAETDPALDLDGVDLCRGPRFRRLARAAARGELQRWIDSGECRG